MLMYFLYFNLFFNKSSTLLAIVLLSFSKVFLITFFPLIIFSFALTRVNEKIFLSLSHIIDIFDSLFLD